MEDACCAKHFLYNLYSVFVLKVICFNLFFCTFIQQFKKRYFVLKQQADMTYILEFFKDEKMIEAKGSIFLELAEEAVKVSIIF